MRLLPFPAHQHQNKLGAHSIYNQCSPVLHWAASSGQKLLNGPRRRIQVLKITAVRILKLTEVISCQRGEEVATIK